jgi:hypothetical protein
MFNFNFMQCCLSAMANDILKGVVSQAKLLALLPAGLLTFGHAMES